MSKIDLQDSMTDVIFKMSEGNPGAVNVLMGLVKHTDEIDPQSGLGWLGPIMLLDSLEIYGSSIYVLCNDKCDKNIRTLIMLLRANQLGLIDNARIQQLAADQSRQINIAEEELKELDIGVCSRLTEFAIPGYACS